MHKTVQCINVINYYVLHLFKFYERGKENMKFLKKVGVSALSLATAFSTALAIPTRPVSAAEEFRVYSNKGRSPLERSVRVGADQRQDGAEKHADNGGQYCDGDGHGKTLQHKSDIGKGENLIKQS